jgi:rhodanese-related sulfurtransferase
MTIRCRPALAALTVLLLAGPMLPAPFGLGDAAAQTAAPPAAAPKAGWYPHQVDAATVRSYAVLPKREDVTIVDARPTARKYDIGHIPTAISLPDSQFDQLAPKLLPRDKSQLVIFYCDGPECILSHQSAFRAERLGYTNVRVYPGGFPDWVQGGNVAAISIAQLKRLLDAQAPLTLVDARPKERKYDKGHIPGAISLPDSQFEQFAAQRLPADRAAPLYFYCDGLACKLSNDSAAKAMKLGYTNVKVIPDGWPGWELAYGAATADAAPAIAAGKEPGSISVASFERIYREAPDSVHLIDVRDPAEFAAGTFKGAVNMPVGSLEKNLDRLPNGKPIVFFCGAGSRSGEAHDLVKAARPDLKTFFLDAKTKWSANGEHEIAGN